jgi:glyceraldehyde-3-phosphate dehydrogenase (NADP+)
MIIKFENEDKIYKNYINGEWVINTNNDYIEIKSPIDDSIVGKVEAMTPKEIDKAVNSAKKAQKEWANTPINVRVDILNKVSDILLKNLQTIGNLLMLEVAKDFKSALSEVKRTAEFIKFTCESAKNISGEAITGDSFPGFDKSKISIVNREPIGVVLAISPFNYPINLSVSKIVPALVMGNSVVFKPATQGAISALYLTKAFEIAGIPKGVINTITGRGVDIGDYVTTHKDIDFINFTGSSEVGKHIASIAKMKPLLMELGGKDAAIVLESADLELTVDNIVSGAFSYSGQRCTAIKRVLVVDSTAGKLVKELIKKVETLKVGNPDIEGVTITPLISTSSANLVQSLIEDAKLKGAKVLTGDKREGNLIYPTVVDYVTDDMDIAWVEAFGPVLPIIRVKNKEEAIKIANLSNYGLQSSVFTNNINEAFYVSKHLEVGTVQINSKPERGPDHFPFLGIKDSGIGVQGIKYSIEAMTRPKSIVININ